MSIQLFYSNDIHALSDRFSRDLGEQTLDPLSMPVVMAPNPYLKEWLLMRLADLDGIAVNYTMQFLDKGLWDLLLLMGENSADWPKLLDEPDLRLFIFSAFLTMDPQNHDCAPIRNYLYDAAGLKKRDFERRAWQLAEKLAKNFLRYEAHRPEIMQAWEKGGLLFKTEMELCQKFLHTYLFGKDGLCRVPGGTMMTLAQCASSAKIKHTGIEVPKIFLFCESQLSRFHGEIIFRLGQVTDIFIYQINPCAEFWEDVETPFEERWNRIRGITVAHDGDGEILSHPENENRLLQLWGKTGREDVKLLSLVEEASAGKIFFNAHWINAAPGEKTGSVLTILQDRILSRASLVKGKKVKQDRSIQVIACPNMFREVEALYHNIIYNLKSDNSLMMTDVAVFVPDMEAYAPVIKSVFLREPETLSFSLIDSSAASESVFGRGLLSILDLAAGDFSRSNFFELITNPCFLQSRGMDAGSAAIWLRWVDELNIYHACHPSGNDGGEGDVFTWSHGMERLRLGRIMEPVPAPESDNVLLNYRGRVPFRDMDSAKADLVGDMGTVVDMVYKRIDSLSTGQFGARRWVEIIESIMNDFLSVPEDRPEEQSVSDAIRQSMKRLLLLESAAAGPVFSLSFIREYVKDNLRAIPGFHGAYLTGGVNISALIPKRHIPFKIVYVLGMGEGNFPGYADTSTLDLLQVKRRIGDVTRPEANRYLFLETLLSTGKKLYISYVSKDLQKDRDFHPNSVVQQLISHIEESVIDGPFKIVTVPLTASSLGYCVQGGDDDISDFIRVHDGGSFDIVNYSLSDRLAIYLDLKKSGLVKDADFDREIEKRKAGRVPDFGIAVAERPSREDEDGTVKINVREIRRFLENPAQASMSRHLRIDDYSDDASLEEEEPFYSVNPLRYQIIFNSLDNYVSSGDPDSAAYPDDFYRYSKLEGRTPVGAFSSVDLEWFRESIDTRISGPEGLKEFMVKRKGRTFYRNIVLGPDSEISTKEKAFPSPSFIFGSSRSRVVEITGKLPFVWRNEDEGACETLVITSSRELRPAHVLGPFIFYVLAAAGFDPEFYDFMGRGDFAIHISTEKGTDSFTYRIPAEEAKAWVRGIVRDLLDETRYDFVPMEIALDRNITRPHDMEAAASEQDKKAYRERFMSLCEENQEGLFPSFTVSELLSIINPAVPADVFDLVRGRFGIFSPPLTRDKDKEDAHD